MSQLLEYSSLAFSQVLPPPRLQANVKLDEVKQRRLDYHIWLAKEKATIDAAGETPLRTLARFLRDAEIKDQENGTNNAEYFRKEYPILRIQIHREIMYRLKYGMNVTFSRFGPTGSGKSNTALGEVEKIHWAFRREPWNIKLLGWDEGQIKNIVRKARPGSCIMMDEDLNRAGGGSMTLEMALENLENALRVKQIGFAWVFTLRRGHNIHWETVTKAANYSGPNTARYFTVQAAIPLATFGSEQGNIYLGEYPAFLPSQNTLMEYAKLKNRFTSGVKDKPLGTEMDFIDIWKAELSDIVRNPIFNNLVASGRKGSEIAKWVRNNPQTGMWRESAEVLGLLLDTMPGHLYERLGVKAPTKAIAEKK